jgi:hypothetical protein
MSSTVSAYLTFHCGISHRVNEALSGLERYHCCIQDNRDAMMASRNSRGPSDVTENPVQGLDGLFIQPPAL